MASLALVGAQYGSEGKGVIAAGLAHRFEAAVRTGGPNAGHSFYHQQTLHKMRQVPCAWVNPKTLLLIGAGAVIDPVLLQAELDRVDRTLIVDPKAVIITPEQHMLEVDQGLQSLIGSTTEGVGAARVAKVRRMGEATLARDYDWGERVVVEPVAPILWDMRDEDRPTMLEGTQGSGLSLHHGHYPFTTSHDTNAAQLAADAGIPPTDVQHTHLVVRTFPIRVAGNSGPTAGEELSWDAFPHVPTPERTTVTNNVRRIFSFDYGEVSRAIMLNDPCGLWVTFGDYVDPEAGDKDWAGLLAGPMGDWLEENIFNETGVPVLGVGVGGQWWRVVESGFTCGTRRRGHTPTRWSLEVDNAAKV